MDGSFLERIAEESQLDSADGLLFYRCYLCKNIVSKWDLEENQGCGCGHGKISPTNLTAWEKVVQIYRHPAVWKWAND